jgi:hypothetical protein
LLSAFRVEVTAVAVMRQASHMSFAIARAPEPVGLKELWARGSARS